MREHRQGRRAVLRALAAVRRVWAQLTRRNDDPGVSLTSLCSCSILTRLINQAHCLQGDWVASSSWSWRQGDMHFAPAVRRHQRVGRPVARLVVRQQPTPQHSLPRSRRRPHPPTALGQAVVLRRRRPRSLPLGEGCSPSCVLCRKGLTVLVDCTTEGPEKCHNVAYTEGWAPSCSMDCSQCPCGEATLDALTPVAPLRQRALYTVTLATRVRSKGRHSRHVLLHCRALSLLCRLRPRRTLRCGTCCGQRNSVPHGCRSKVTQRACTDHDS